MTKQSIKGEPKRMPGKENIERLFNEAIHHHQSGNLDAALALYDRILSIDPQCTDAWFNKGNILGQQRAFEAALDCYQKALGLAKYRKEVIFRSMGMVEHIRGNLDRAIFFHRQALRENRRYGLAWLGLIQALISDGKGKEAQDECRMFMLNCTVEDGPLYFKVKRLVDQFIKFGIKGDPGEFDERWIK